MGIPVEWTSGLEGEAKQQFIQYLMNSRGILSQLAKMVMKKDGAAVNMQLDINSFDSPNWDKKMAFLNGKTAAYKEVLKLIVFSDQEKK